MEKISKTLLIFEINDQFSSICSIKENKKGELIILPNFAKNYTEIEYGNPHNDKEIVDQHYTIHHSREINEDVNVLNHTLKLKNGFKKNTRIYTRAFNNNLFCPILSVRGQDFSRERYNCIKNDTDDYVNLGKYLPNESTVFYMIIAANSKSTFKGNYEDLNYVNLNFENYSLVILWSFGLMPSHSTGNKYHLLTSPEYNTQLQEGYEEAEVINIFRLNRQLQYNSFLEFIRKEIKFRDIDFVLAQSIGFKKIPNRNIDDSDKDKMNLNLGFYSFSKGKKEYRNGNHKKAIIYFSESKNIFNKHKKKVSLADVLNSEGILYHTIGKSKESIKAYNESLAKYIELNLNFNIARTYLNLSMVYRDIMQIQKSKENIQKSINISEEKEFYSLLSDSYRELGILYKNDGNVTLAEVNLNKALTAYNKDKNHQGVAFCLGNLGLIQAINGDVQKSLQLHKEALDIFIALNDQWGIANETANVGNMNCTLGNETGLKQLNQALEMHNKNGFKYGVATDLKVIGIYYCNKGEMLKGIKFLEKSKNVLLDIGNKKEAEIIVLLIEKIKSC